MKRGESVGAILWVGIRFAVSMWQLPVAALIGGNVQTRDMLNKTPLLKDMQNTSMLFVFSL